MDLFTQVVYSTTDLLVDSFISRQPHISKNWWSSNQSLVAASLALQAWVLWELLNSQVAICAPTIWEIMCRLFLTPLVCKEINYYVGRCILFSSGTIYWDLDFFPTPGSTGEAFSKQSSFFGLPIIVNVWGEWNLATIQKEKKNAYIQRKILLWLFVLYLSNATGEFVLRVL